jgi:hypothetical protein
MAGHTGRDCTGAGLLCGRTFRRIHDGTWQNLTDPATFIMSSFLALFFAPPATAPRDGAYFAALGARIGGVLAMIVVLLARHSLALYFPLCTPATSTPTQLPCLSRAH